jgi:hypothetical protein
MVYQAKIAFLTEVTRSKSGVFEEVCALFLCGFLAYFPKAGLCDLHLSLYLCVPAHSTFECLNQYLLSVYTCMSVCVFLLSLLRKGCVKCILLLFARHFLCGPCLTNGESVCLHTPQSLLDKISAKIFPWQRGII